MGLKITFVALFACIVPLILGQTFQYSRGWTNGKRSGFSPKDTVCDIHRIKAILEGMSINPYFWPCSYRSLPEINGRLLGTLQDFTKLPITAEVNENK